VVVSAKVVLSRTAVSREERWLLRRGRTVTDEWEPLRRMEVSYSGLHKHQSRDYAK